MKQKHSYSLRCFVSVGSTSCGRSSGDGLCERVNTAVVGVGAGRWRERERERGELTEKVRGPHRPSHKSWTRCLAAAAACSTC